MLKGHVFNLQTFTAEAFAITFDKVLQGRCGVLKGCDLSNTSNSATIGEGFFVVRGRPLQIVGSESISNISNNGYYSLVCEVDLSKTNTVDELKQAEIKTVYNANNYPTLTQQDITGNGTVYQYEFARFQVSGGSINNFTDRRTYLDFETLYDLVEDTLEGLENQSDVAMKTDVYLKGDYAILTGSITLTNGKGTTDFNYPDGFSQTNCVPISAGTRYSANIDRIAFGSVQSTIYTGVYLSSNKVEFNVDAYNSGIGPSGTFGCRVVLMKIS